MTDTISVERQDLNILPETKANFQEPKVYLNRIYTEVEEWDTLYRIIQENKMKYRVVWVKHITGIKSLEHTMLEVQKYTPYQKEQTHGAIHIWSFVNNGNFAIDNNGTQNLTITQGFQIEKIIELIQVSNHPQKQEIIQVAQDYKLSPNMDLFWKLITLVADSWQIGTILGAVIAWLS